MADPGPSKSQEAPDGDAQAGDSSDPSPAAGPDALAEAMRRLAEARTYAVYWGAAEFDRLKLRFRRIVMWAIVGIVAVVILCSLLVAAAFMLLFGVAAMLSAIFGWPTWAGCLLIGGGMLLLGVAAMLIDFWAWNREGFRSGASDIKNLDKSNEKISAAASIRLTMSTRAKHRRQHSRNSFWFSFAAAALSSPCTLLTKDVSMRQLIGNVSAVFSQIVGGHSCDCEHV